MCRDIRRATRKKYSTEDNIRVVLSGLRGEHSIGELCRRDEIAESRYYVWSKEFRRLARSGWPGIADGMKGHEPAINVTVPDGRFCFQPPSPTTVKGAQKMGWA